MNKEAKVIFSITAVVIIGIIIFMIVSSGSLQTSGAVNQAYLENSASHMTGTTSAKVTIVEFGDYECPACGAAYPIFKQVIAAYATNTQFNFVFRNYPLPQHANAMIAAEAAEAAGAQGKFWQMHDLLYENQNDWADSSTPITFFVQYATQIGLDVAKFKSDVEDSAYASVIAKDQSDGNALDVEWTPSIFVNGVLQQETPTFDQFKSQIDSLLAQ